MAANQTLRQRVVQQMASMKAERSTWEPLWRDIDQWIWPDHAQFVSSDANRGTIRTTSIIDATPTLAVRTSAAGLMSGITSPARPWFKLKAADPELMEDLEVRDWLEECEDTITSEFQTSNLYQSLPVTYGNLVTFGTECVMFDEVGDPDAKGGLFRFYNLPVGSYYLSANAEGRVDCVFRDFTMTVRQLCERFGDKALTPATKAQYDSGSLETGVPVIHGVFPNPEHDPQRIGGRFKKFLSCWWEAGATDEQWLSIQGYDEFPYLAPRWEVTGRNVYGFGPARICIGSCKALQAYKRRIAESVAKAVNPPLIAPSSLRGQEVLSIPGGVTYYDEVGGGPPRIGSLYNQTFDPKGAQQEVMEIRQEINQTFFVDLFLMMANSDRRQVTAEEIRAKQEEKILAIGPVYERTKDELLDPLIDRAFAILWRRGRINAPPKQIAGKPIKVEYDSILAQAMKMLRLGTIDRLVQAAQGMAQLDPTVLDRLNFDTALKTYAQDLQAPVDLMRKDEEVDGIKQQRQAAQAKQQQQVDAQHQAQVAQQLGNAPTQPGTALGDLIRQQTGAQI